MSAYVIDFSEPLKEGFSIPAGGFNGPGGSSANTTLRLYGRGALEWGEAVNEDLVRLAENFAGASAPSIATNGQLWIETFMYYHDNDFGVLSGWYFYNVNSLLSNKWQLVSGTGNVPSSAPLTPVEGQYYYLTTGGDPGGAGAPLGTLFGFYSLGRYEPATWVARSYMNGTGAPTSGNRPDIRLRVRDGAQSVWASPVTTTISSGTPTNPTTGMLWYNTSTGNLNLRTNVGTWQEILGPSNGTAASRASGPMEMGNGTINYQIKNMLDPTDAQDATTKAYVDSTVAGGVAGAGFLPLTGGTLSVTSATGLTINRTNAATNSAVRFQTTGGSIWVGQGNTGVFAVDDDSSLSASPWLTATSTAATVIGSLSTGSSMSVGTSLNVGSTATVGSTLTVSGTSNMQAINGTSLGITGAATISGLLSKSNTRITDLAAALSGNDAVNLTQVNSLISTATSGSLSAASVALANPGGAPKNCDIRTFAPNIVEIYSNGAWRRVFPAQWV
jgi:hypothetical protein